MRTMTEYFFMRDGFKSFRLEPDKHNYLLFGERDRVQRNYLLDHLEEASYSLEGFKSVVIGDYGRGKTHQSKNLEYEIKRRGLNLYPIYIKCTEFKSKEQFSTFFRELLLGIPTQEDRVIQHVIKSALEPFYESQFESNSIRGSSFSEKNLNLEWIQTRSGMP